MNEQLSEKDILNAVIIGFRNLINERYQYDNIHRKYDIPDSFDEERVAVYRNYFLEQIYPPPEKREVLDEAFRSLDNYITHPEKLLRILFDSTVILLRYGRHIPKLLSAGLKAFRSFRVATGFEQKLVRMALKSDIPPPFGTDQINSFIAQLPRRDIDQFIENSRILLELLNQRNLIQEIIDVLEHLIERIKRLPKAYSATEIAGLELGLTMIKEGDRLFDQLSEVDQNRIFNIIIQIEQDVLDELFSSPKSSPEMT